MGIKEIREAFNTNKQFMVGGRNVDILLFGKGTLYVEHSDGGGSSWAVGPSELKIAPAPKADLEDAIEKLMQDVTPKNAVERTQKKYKLCKEYGEKTGDWGAMSDLTKGKYCPLCEAFLQKEEACPLINKKCGGCCDNQWGRFYHNPTRDTFMGLYDKIFSLGKKPEVEVKPGQVWESECGNRWMTTRAGFAVLIEKHAKQVTGIVGMEYETEIPENHTLLPGYSFKVVGPNEKVIECPQDCVVVKKDSIEITEYIIENGMRKAVEKRSKPEPTLSFDYVRKHACGGKADWFEKQFGNSASVKDVLIKAMMTQTGPHFISVQNWLIEHGLIDDSLQITGVSK